MQAVFFMILATACCDPGCWSGKCLLRCCIGMLTFQVGVVMPDDIVGKVLHHQKLHIAPAGWQLEGPKAHPAGRHSADHCAGLHLNISAALASKFNTLSMVHVLLSHASALAACCSDGELKQMILQKGVHSFRSI